MHKTPLMTEIVISKTVVCNGSKKRALNGPLRASLPNGSPIGEKRSLLAASNAHFPPSQHKNPDMTTEKAKKTEQILNEIESLCSELRLLLVESDHGGVDPPKAGQLRVLVTNGRHRGASGRVTGRRGSQFWWIKLDGTGEMVYKMPHNVRVLPTKSDTTAGTCYIYVRALFALFSSAEAPVFLRFVGLIGESGGFSLSSSRCMSSNSCLCGSINHDLN